MIQKLSGPEDLAGKGFGSVGCIKEFWTENQIAEAYLVEPKTQEALDYFELQGIAHRPEGWDAEDVLTSPFGLYAARLYDGVPMTLHFVWARRDQDLFFKDKPYSVFNVLWSIRFARAQ